MNLLTAINICSTGLSAERTRLNIASMNLANAHVTRTLDGGPYRARSVVFAAVPYEDPEAPSSSTPFAESLADEVQALQTVQVSEIVEDPNPFREIHDPSHPDADERGIVRLPNVNVMEQMMDIMTAARAYEANTTAISTAKSMALKALDIGR
jgi:flagellar basal-body rod protein FlgC